MMLLDYHDDVVVLDNESSPEKANFYQIKTKSSATWTIAALTRKPKGKDGAALPSIFDKLYSAHSLCGEGARQLCFVSNKPVKVKLMGKSKKEEVDACTFRDMDASEKEIVHKCIEGDASSLSDYEGLCKLEIHRTPLSLDDHESHAKGRLVAFFESIFPDKNVPASAVYRTLLDEIRRKTNDDSVYSEFTALVKAKGIGKSDFRKIISLVGKRLGADALWDTAKAFLIKESVSPAVLTALKTAFFSYAVTHMNPIDEDIQQLTSSIRKLIDENREEWVALDLSTIAENTYTLIKTQKVTGSYSSEFIRAAAIYEVLDETVQEANPQLTETPV